MPTTMYEQDAFLAAVTSSRDRANSEPDRTEVWQMLADHLGFDTHDERAKWLADTLTVEVARAALSTLPVRADAPITPEGMTALDLAVFALQYGTVLGVQYAEAGGPTMVRTAAAAYREERGGDPDHPSRTGERFGASSCRTGRCDEPCGPNGGCAR